MEMERRRRKVERGGRGAAASLSGRENQILPSLSQPTQQSLSGRLISHPRVTPLRIDLGERRLHEVKIGVRFHLNCLKVMKDVQLRRGTAAGGEESKALSPPLACPSQSPSSEAISDASSLPSMSLLFLCSCIGSEGAIVVLKYFHVVVGAHMQNQGVQIWVFSNNYDIFLLLGIGSLRKMCR